MDTKKNIFLADYQDQLKKIKKIYITLEKRVKEFNKKNVNPEMVESTGYWLHNLYCAYEDIFKIVASFWENNLPMHGTYHKDLLRRMKLEIEGIRPALLSEENYENLNELRSFRHLFRHAYSYGLDDERVNFLLQRIIKKKNNILKQLDLFANKIEDIKTKKNRILKD